jgi:hypothetical protein
MKDIILCSDEGLAVRIDDGPVMSLPWADVRRVQAYRIDAGGSQLLAVGVEDETGHTVELNASMDGWPAFIASLARHTGRPEQELSEALERMAAGDAPIVLFQSA